MKKKLSLGKPTLRSIEIQILATLQPCFEGGIKILKIQPKRTNTGNIVVVGFRALNEPDVRRSRIFGMQRFHDCCDIWLEAPAILQTRTSDNNSAA